MVSPLYCIFTGHPYENVSEVISNSLENLILRIGSPLSSSYKGIGNFANCIFIS
jgi:hypothetical protein